METKPKGWYKYKTPTETKTIIKQKNPYNPFIYNVFILYKNSNINNQKLN